MDFPTFKTEFHLSGEQLLPHRPPFLFVDELVVADETGALGCYAYTVEKNDFFRGHFPKYPVVPGVILIETMAQGGGAALSLQKKFDEGSLFFLATVNNVKFKHQVRPGDTVRMEVVNKRCTKNMVVQEGKAYVGETLCAQAEWMCLVGKGDNK